MPNVTAAKKALRQNRKARLRNRHQRATLRSSLKNASAVAETGSADEAKAAVRDAMSKLGKAGKKHLYHPRKASRLASRLQKRVNRIVAEKG
jgi:small subunit ribosomal protein S20